MENIILGRHSIADSFVLDIVKNTRGDIHKKGAGMLVVNFELTDLGVSQAFLTPKSPKRVNKTN